jgi:2-oxoglutarate ferredoxin oxidoreductase subunit beta
MSRVQDLLGHKEAIASFDGKHKHTWCSGCGNFGITSALKQALALEGKQPHQALLCYDVGCNGNESDKINAYTIHGLHGRVLPLAAGAKLGNENLEVIAQAGDGATFSEGINHLIHAIRNDYNLTFICHNNSNYGLTIGQASSTTRKGVQMNATPDGVLTDPLNTLQLVLASNPTFVARGFSGNIQHMTELIRQGMNHKGFSYIEIFQACPTFNKETPQEWYWDKIYYLNQDNHDSSDIWEARKKAEDMDNKLALGVFYQAQVAESFIDQQVSRKGFTTALSQEVKDYDVKEYLQANFV